MKAILICPASRPGVATLAEKAPLAALPLLGSTVIEYWLVHLACLGARRVTVLAPDRPGAIRRIVGDGARWGMRVETVSCPAEPTVEEARTRYCGDDADAKWLPEYDAVSVMDRPPGFECNMFGSYAEWFAAIQLWVPFARTPDRVGMREISPGVHVGLHTRIPAGTRLFPPCWIGEKVLLGSRVAIGPFAVIENGAMIESGAEIVRAIVGPATRVGRSAQVSGSLAWEETLIDWKSGSCLRVPDIYLLGPLRGELIRRRRRWRFTNLWSGRVSERGPRTASLEDGALIRR